MFLTVMRRFRQSGWADKLPACIIVNSFMALKPDGERFERITYFPMSTVTDVQITTTDIEDLGGVNAFALEPEMVPQYNFTFLGKGKD